MTTASTTTPGNNEDVNDNDDDALNVSTPHVGDIELSSSSSSLSPSGSPQKSPSVAAAIAAFGGGGGKNKNQSQTNQEQNQDQALFPTLPADMEEEEGMTNTAATPIKQAVESSLPVSPPFSPSTPPPPPPSSSDNDAIATDSNDSVSGKNNGNIAENIQETNNSSSSDDNDKMKMPIMKLLEVENELRKREDAMSNEGEFEKSTENDTSDDENTRGDNNTMENETGELMTTTDSPATDERGQSGEMMQVSDSEQEDSYCNNEVENEDEVEEEEWEGFMANYWKQSSSSATNNVINPQQVKSIIANESTDLKPCIMEPELDEEPKENALSPMRTGCMDIDMDFNDHDNDGMKSDRDTGTMNQLSVVGLECSVAMARAVKQEKGRKSQGGMNKNGMESLRIHVGKIERCRTPKKRNINEQEQEENTPLIQQQPTGSLGQEQPQPASNHVSAVAVPTMATATATLVSSSMPQDTFDMHNPDLKLLPTSTRSFDTRSDDVDKKSTKSSAQGSEVSEISRSGSWKHKTTPTPPPNLIHMTGPILTRT
eukprot:CAMPEP_0172313574 /NCGR_PEP_ID=MMETSP1058-20130122/20491_1 /TAXON_ID=83371 /ORGANISM="Detonula confervacea, Strain CCMP 353" /LENGTH=542 /DNA_ID=CAMNT_0013027249 /DNA_START=1 /DNA_END=1625 /DNA_ORIENTATION=+